MFQSFDPDSPAGQLASLLRDQSRWPRDFTWDFANCNSCAMGLAAASGYIKAANVDSAAKWLGVSYARASQIFVERRADGYYAPNWASTTPDEVARDLDALEPVAA